MSVTYKQDLRDIAVAVAQNSKAYTDKKIEDLKWELGTYDLGVDTVNGTTMLLPTPANTIQATMVEIDGASEVSENLIVLNDVAETTVDGITYKVENGIIYVKGTTTTSANVEISILSNINLSGAFNLFSSLSSASLYYRTGASAYYSSATQQTRTNLTLDRFNLILGGTGGTAPFSQANYITIKPMLVSGSSAPTEFKVGYDGIHNLELSGLKVEGSNILNPDNTFTYSSYTDLAYFECVGGATYTLKSFGSYTGSFGVFKYDGNSWSSIEAHSLNNGYTITAPSDAIRIGVNGVVSQNVMVVRGSTTPTSYVPYIAPTTKTIDLSTILYNGNPLFEGNSLKAVGTAKDYITPYKAHKEVIPITFDGSNDEGWSYEGSGYYRFRITNFGVNKGILVPTSNNNFVAAKSSSNDYPIETGNGGFNNRSTTKSIAMTTDSNLYFYDYSITSLSNWKAHLQENPITVLFVLTTSIEVSIDFSQLVKFEAHSNGSITLVNTNNQDTTSTFKYLKEVAK